MINRALVLAGLMWLIVSGSAWAYLSPGKPVGWVNDYAGVLSAPVKQRLENELTTVSASTSAQIAVVTITSLDGDTIENYAVKLFEEWGIGQKGTDNGVLFLTAVNDHKVRIEVGYGLEGTLTDAQSAAIIRNVITPAYKRNDFDTGISQGTEAIMKTISGEVQPVQPASTRSSAPNVGGLIFLFFVFQTLVGILSRTKSWWLGGVLGGIIGLIVSLTYGFMIAGLIALAILVPLGLLFDFLVSRNPPTRGSSPWWYSGGSGWGSSSGGGFGGFGGGRSGGGGSSGSW